MKKRIWDYVWITTVTIVTMFAAVSIPMACQADDIYEIVPPSNEEYTGTWRQLPDRKQYLTSPTLYALFAAQAERAMRVRQANPNAEVKLQVWADMETRVWTLNILTVETIRFKDRIMFAVVMVLPGAPTPYEYRRDTGKECVYSLDLRAWEWYHGKEAI